MKEEILGKVKQGKKRNKLNRGKEREKEKGEERGMEDSVLECCRIR